MGTRIEKLSAELREAVQAVINRGLADPRISGIITVMEVRVAEDQRTATVLISVLPHERESKVIHGLQAAAGHVRHEIGDRLRHLRVPTLTFRLDQSMKKQAEVLGAIHRASEERQRREADNPPPAGAPGEGPAEPPPGRPAT